MPHTINLAEFAQYVEYDSTVWQQTIGHGVVEEAYGTGTIKQIAGRSMYIEFRQGMRVFPLSLFVHGYKGMVLSLSQSLEEIIHSLRVQKEGEINAAKEFAVLKSTFLAETHKDPSPTSPLYIILLQMQAGNPLTSTQLEWLQSNKLYGTLALYWQNSFRQSREPWDLIKASRYWRSARQPEKVITLTNYLLNKYQFEDNQLLSAILTTRGGAFRDLGDYGSAEHCGQEALRYGPSNFQPHNLLGAIYFTLGNPEAGEKHFAIAIELGAPPRLQDTQIRVALSEAGEQEKVIVARYLLQKDPQRYKWAASYLA